MTNTRKSPNLKLRLQRLEARFNTLWHRSYARLQRKDRQKDRIRKNFEMKILRFEKQVKRYDHMMKRLVALLAHRPKRKVGLYVTPKESLAFNYYLRTRIMYLKKKALRGS